ncbi:unnamed protein product, partial [Symbiodinium sp. KB8]
MASKAGLPLRGPGFEVEPPDKANFRSIGRGNGGVIKKRIPVYIKDVDPATPSSMPTKYQTVLYRKNREKRGFSCSTTRTAQTRAMAEVVPGPGAYSGDLVIQELEESTKTSTSTSSSVSQVALRGRGTFASRTPRLVHPSKQHGYVPPGPGTYIMRDVQRDSSPTAAFSLPGPGNPAKFNVVETEPGPASYLGPDDAVPPIGCQGARAVFGSSPRATQQVRDPDLPGPGQYDQIDGEERLRSTRPSQKQLSPRPEPLTDLETLKLRRGEEILKSNTSEDVSSPGPGQYTPRLDAVRGPKQFNARGHSSFHIGNSHLPRKWRQPGPGPTDYVPPIGQARPRDAPWPLSTLASSSERFAKQQGSGAPGPAFYSPKHEPGAVVESNGSYEQKAVVVFNVEQLVFILNGSWAFAFLGQQDPAAWPLPEPDAWELVEVPDAFDLRPNDPNCDCWPAREQCERCCDRSLGHRGDPECWGDRRYLDGVWIYEQGPHWQGFEACCGPDPLRLRRGTALYQTEVEAAPNTAAILHFGACTNRCLVRVDGELLADHAGLSPFEVEVPPSVEGRRRILVIADNSFNMTTHPVHQPKYDWYQAGGLIRSVQFHALRGPENLQFW